MRAGGFPAKAGIYSSARAWIFARVAGFAVAELVHCLGVNGITAFERQDPARQLPEAYGTIPAVNDGPPTVRTFTGG